MESANEDDELSMVRNRRNDANRRRPDVVIVVDQLGQARAERRSVASRINAHSRDSMIRNVSHTSMRRPHCIPHSRSTSYRCATFTSSSKFSSGQNLIFSIIRREMDAKNAAR